MTQPTLTLTDFLIARIAEDEAVARAYPERFWYDAIKVEEDDPLREFLDRFDAARVLADCEAKRRIVESIERRRVRTPAMIAANDETLRLLALPYADHESFREEWRP